MQRSILYLAQQLTDLLLEFPAIVGQFETKSPLALMELTDWMNRSEELLSGRRMAQAAEIAGFKSNIFAPIYDDDKRGALRKRQLAAAVGVLQPVQQCVQTALQPQAAKVQQSRELVRHLLQIVAQSGAVVYDAAAGIEALTAQVWALCCQHEQLKPHTVQLKSLLPSDDIRLLLIEEIEPVDFSPVLN